MITCAELLRQLNQLDEHPRIEAKTASELGKSAVQTVSAYSNEPCLGGGYLLLGVERVPDLFDREYRAAGVPDPDKVQADLASQCASMLNRVIRPEMWAEVVDGKVLVGAFVPEAQPGEKPIFFTAQGLPRGAYRRIGSSDQRCTEDDLLVLYQGRQHRTYDLTPIPDVELADLDSDAIAEYRRERARANAAAEELRWPDDELLRSLGCLVRHEGRLVATVAGVLLFGTRMTLRRVFPMMRLDYIRIPGREWISDPEKRFETLDMRDPLMRPEDQLGEPGSQTRNPAVAAVLHETLFAETKGSGIRVMRELMRQTNLAPPTFESDRERDQFTTTLFFHHLLDEADLAWLSQFSELNLSTDEAKALVHIREAGRITNAVYRELNGVDPLAASMHLRRLRQLGLLRQHDRGSATYYTPTERLLFPQERELSAPGGGVGRGESRPLPQSGELSPESGELSPESGELSAESGELPGTLAAAVRSLKRRTPQPELRSLIYRLCLHRPFSSEALARLLQRDQAYLLEQYLAPMVRDGELEYLIPDRPTDPRQAYIAAPKESGDPL